MVCAPRPNLPYHCPVLPTLPASSADLPAPVNSGGFDGASGKVADWHSSSSEDLGPVPCSRGHMLVPTDSTLTIMLVRMWKEDQGWNRAGSRLGQGWLGQDWGGFKSGH